MPRTHPDPFVSPTRTGSALPELTRSTAESASDVERRRLVALHAYDVVHADTNADLQRLAALAALLTSAPLGLVNVAADSDMVQVAVSAGSATRTALSDVPCSWVVANATPVHVPDAGLDDRFRHSPYVDGRLSRTRLYASVPLLEETDLAIGTVCVLDDRARELTPEQMNGLELIAEQVMAVLAERRHALHLQSLLRLVEEEAHIDPLTGLLSRAAGARALERVHCRGDWALLFLDVDNLKTVNDLGGHEAGDAVLIEVSRRLLQALRPQDLLIRWAGDEFVALLHDVTDEDMLSQIARRTSDHVAQPLAVAEHTIHIGVSTGAVLLNDTSDPATALHRADLDMYADKRRRKG